MHFVREWKNKFYFEGWKFFKCLLIYKFSLNNPLEFCKIFVAFILLYKKYVKHFKVET